ncbi:unnamed protein product [Cyclocybe aegerita]|uniref:Uncharacterized protein n=1 Tax=Cyclocybe aegerita TaxID=1973307 RepID=A0A8S0WEG7_CYCAE|nr:unnamed protein product [Cyclocybe aegerita]
MSSVAPKNNNASDQQTKTGPPSSDGTSYPEQRHAGQVGYGPNYHTGPTLEEKVAGLKEELMGKVTRSPARVQHGRELLSGEERRKKLSDEPNPFTAANKDDHETKSPARLPGPSVGVSSSTVPSNSTVSAINLDRPSSGPDQNPQFHSGYPPRPNPSGMGTHDAHVQSQGEAVDRVKYI